MNISIIVGGRFHAFNLAEQLNKKNYLKQLITTYPKFYIKKNFNIKNGNINSLIIKELVQRSFLNKIYNFNDYLIENFDRNAANLLELNDLDILIGWSSYSYNAFIKAKNKKCVKILERGSTHIEFQNEILNEEYKFQSIKPKQISKYIIDKEKKEYDLADYIMVPTDFVKQTFIDKGFQNKKIIKNPYGVNLEEFKNSRSRIKNLDKFRIIYVGAVSVRKGILYLLQAFNDLEFSDIELLIVGNIEHDLIKRLNEYYSNKKIIFKKSVKQSDLKNFYNISDVFVTCSIEEGLSMVQLQAMSCGIPVISNVNAGGQEIITDGVDGFIIPIRDKISLKEKIIYLYNNQNVCLQMGKNAREKIINNYSWEKYGAKAISIYQNLLNK